MTRMYSYNLDVGEHYYSPMTTYLDRNSSVERTARAETPGAMTFSERLQHRWINGRRYESSARSASVARESGVAVSASGTEATAFAPRAARASSEVPVGGRVAFAAAAGQSAAQAAGAMSSASMAAQSEQRQQQSASAYASRATMKQEAMSSSTLQASAKSSSMTSSREETTQEITRSSASSATAKKVQMMQAEQRARMLEVSQRASSQQRSASSRREQAQETRYQKAADIKVNDCIEKKIADIRMQPYIGNQEIRDAEAASLRARARIMDLERELDEITKRAIMTSTKAVKSAKQMAYEASMEAAEEAKASSTKKSRKVIVESKSSIKA